MDPQVDMSLTVAVSFAEKFTYSALSAVDGGSLSDWAAAIFTPCSAEAAGKKNPEQEIINS